MAQLPNQNYRLLTFPGSRQTVVVNSLTEEVVGLDPQHEWKLETTPDGHLYAGAVNQEAQFLQDVFNDQVYKHPKKHHYMVQLPDGSNMSLAEYKKRQFLESTSHGSDKVRHRMSSVHYFVIFSLAYTTGESDVGGE